MEICAQHILGFDETALTAVPGQPRQCLQADVIDDWLQLVAAAESAGFEVVMVSSYRSFERQMAIWSGKALGQRKVLDDDDVVVDMASCTELEKLYAIMRFSALPGASRHHWGTDFDIAERSQWPEGYQLQLTVSETQTLMRPFYDWLDEYLAASDAVFFRPYAFDYGGVAVEPWHLSHRCAAMRSQLHVNAKELKRFYQDIAQGKHPATAAVLAHLGLTSMPLIDTVNAHFDEIYYRFIEQESA